MNLLKFISYEILNMFIVGGFSVSLLKEGPTCHISKGHFFFSIAFDILGYSFQETHAFSWLSPIFLATIPSLFVASLPSIQILIIGYPKVYPQTLFIHSLPRQFLPQRELQKLPICNNPTFNFQSNCSSHFGNIQFFQLNVMYNVNNRGIRKLSAGYMGSMCMTITIFLLSEGIFQGLLRCRNSYVQLAIISASLDSLFLLLHLSRINLIV